MCEGHLHKECAIKEDGEHYCDTCHIIKSSSPKKLSFELPEYVRRSHIETYRLCPYKFKMEVLEGNVQPDTCYTKVGNDLHELFEKALHDRSYTHQNMTADYAKLWNEYPEDLFETSKQKEDMAKRAEDSIKTFYTTLLSIPMPFVTEKTIFYSIGEGLPEVRFTMDLIVENEQGNLEMHDWKTGRVMVGQKINTDLQAPLYIYGVEKHYGRQVDSFTFHYLNEGKTRTFHRVSENVYECQVRNNKYRIDLINAIREVKSLFSHIVKGNFDVPKNPKYMKHACNICHIRKAGLCSGAEEQVWKFN